MRYMIAAVAAPLILAACGGPAAIQETATSVPHRDLTLTTSPSPDVQVASRIELAVVRRVHRARTVQPAAPARIAPQPDPAAAEPAPILVVAPEPAPAPTPVAVAETPRPDPTGRELAPGATVTVIPVSSAGSAGSVSAGGDWSEVPARRGRGIMIGGHGGNCGGRGRGPVSILR